MRASSDIPELSIVVTVWSREHNLPKLLPSLRGALRGLVSGDQILVAAGPEMDHLAPVVEANGATLVIATRDGYGDILRAGIGRARGRFVLTMDGDFSHLPKFVRTMWHNRFEGEVVIGSRYVRGAYAEMEMARRLASRALNTVYRKGLSVPFRDISSGFRMYRQEVLEDIQPLEASGLDVLLEILVKAICQGWNVVEVPYWYRGSGPWTRARALRLGSDYARTVGRLVSLRNSIRAADYDHRAFDSWIPLQRYWQRARFQIVQGYLADVSGRVLDIGCGSSRIVQTLPDVIGMDLALRKLRWLRAPGRALVQGDLTRLPFEDGAFDAVVCSEVIEHIPVEQVRLEELVRVLAPGGVLVLGTPDYGRWTWRSLEWVYGKVFPNGYVHEHINRYTFSELGPELERLGLRVQDCRYVGASEMIFEARRPPLPERASSPEPLRAGSTGG